MLLSESQLRRLIRELLEESIIIERRKRRRKRRKKRRAKKKIKGSGKKYSVLSQKCTKSDGKKGTHVLKIKPKPGKYKGRKRDSQGRVKIGCHTSAGGANKQRSAIEAG